MRTFFFLLIANLAGCYGGRRGAEPAGTDPAEPAELPPIAQERFEAPAVEAPFDVLTCAGDAELDFRVRGEDLGDFEGARVGAAAIENDWTPDGTESRRPVLLQGEVVDGSFSLSCANSLSENFAYPSYALYVDVDDDDRCSAGDLAYQMQFYGWGDSVEDLVHPDALLPIDDVGIGVGTDGPDFCGSYFD